MTTPRSRSLVSVVSVTALLASNLVLGACAARTAPATVVAARSAALTIGFENEAQVQVDVYLVGEQQQWRLGRVAPGTRTMLRVPEAALHEGSAFMRLAVLADATLSVDAARDSRATLTLAQPVSELLAQQWTFWHPQLASARLLGAAVRVGQRTP